eukprot:TRINITY_DN11181_c0_g1_i2.p1 TRINITY_DN11181_c0_g1~~TRINITY_DN11181_c0_g1_i2.p1  ORF type:complete len:300 (+),score=55.61 TRINITY_DN11181_c0_g1_i2:6-905(+)
MEVLRKRKRTTTVSSACDSCRNAHSKCDGAQPCSRCVLKELGECVYSQKRRRGPKRGKVKSLERENEELKQALKIANHQLTQMKDNTSVDWNNMCLERYFIDSTRIHFYANSYSEFIYPMTGVSLPSVQAAMQNKTMKETKTFMHFALSMGAIMAGDTEAGTGLLMEGKNALDMCYDSVDFYTTASHALMYRHYFHLGEYEKSIVQSSLSVAKCQGLKMRYLCKGMEVPEDILNLERGIKLSNFHLHLMDPEAADRFNSNIIKEYHEDTENKKSPVRTFQCCVAIMMAVYGYYIPFLII